MDLNNLINKRIIILGDVNLVFEVVSVNIDADTIYLREINSNKLNKIKKHETHDQSLVGTSPVRLSLIINGIANKTVIYG